MKELKCPICNKPMKQATYDYDKKDNNDTLYMSIMPCDCVCNFAASKAVWELLADTKKKLDIAVDRLKGIKAYYDDSYADPHTFVNWYIVAQRLANDAIKTIEQIKDNDKDVKCS